ncbi:DMT family transporter [Naumannella halotolerans]|uniref:Putative membrane protein n=1 Tax=Naumannella halotolerans TaxID=993414 RepID=A0A4R7J3U7_9ACTN|nr:DMT family transporter [Naumannella halotolerans]TDT31077.1 putative membrane protein [Naumannella halotolerans]
MAPTTGRLPLLPAAGFVLIWSSGYLAGPIGTAAMSPLMLVAARFAVAAVLAAGLALALRRPRRISQRTLSQLIFAGVMLNAVQFGAMYLAFDAGLSGTLASLAHSLSPVLTAVLAALLLGERLSKLQVVGFAVGVCGVIVVLGPDVGAVGGVASIVLAVVSVLGLSLGTLGQRSSAEPVDPLWGAAVQFAVAVPPVFVVAMLVEGTDPARIVLDPTVAIPMVLYIAVFNSIVGLGLLGILVRTRGPGAAASIFFLMPPVTALLSWIVLGETLNARELIGLLIAVAGVAAATRSSAAATAARSPR